MAHSNRSSISSMLSGGTSLSEAVSSVPSSTAQAQAHASILSQPVEDQWFDCQQRATNIVVHLLKQDRYNQNLISAYETRVASLEAEIERLAKENARVLGQDSHDKPWLLPSAFSRRSSTDSEYSTRETIEAVKREPTPQIDPKVSMSKQNPPPCNSYYLVGHCAVPRCKFSHAYKLTPTQLEEMRRGARFHRCNALKTGNKCLDPSCVYGHYCPRRTACSRTSCAFSDAEHLTIPNNNVSQLESREITAQVNELLIGNRRSTPSTMPF